MRDMMKYRGPDDAGVWCDPSGECVLVHRRLSVMDLSSDGRQPMWNETEELIITFNGEIYNHLKLRKELESRGHIFKTRTDSECIAHLMEEKMDAEGVNSLKGMFAFAAWDTKERKLLLARDHFGKKPLYYAQGPGWFAFSSELTPLTILPGFDSTISRDNVAKYLILQYIPAPNSIYDGAKKLPPGTSLTLDYSKKVRIEPFIERHADFEFFCGDPALGFGPPMYSRQTPSQSRLAAVLLNKFRRIRGRYSEKNATNLLPARVEQLRKLIIKATEQRLMSDVPLGAFLSGGVDSSLVVAIMTKELGLKPETFAIGFDGTDETEHQYAKMVAEHLGTRHREKILKPDVLSTVRQVAEALDEPNGDSSCLPTLLLSEFARNHVTVALSGDGGDELFGGYSRYFQTLEEEHTSVLKGLAPWSPSRAYMSFRIFVYLPEMVAKLMGGLPQETSDYFSTWSPWLDNNSLPLMHRMRALDAATYLPGAVLAKVDRMSMQHSLEVRSPLLDYDLAHFAESLSPEECYSNGSGKNLLKAVAAKYIPYEWLERRKMGFGLPMTFWKPKELVAFAREVTMAPNSPVLDWMDRTALDQYLKQQEDPALCSVYQMWTLLILALWTSNKAGASSAIHV